MPAPTTATYDARWGYRHFDARRYEQRRYGGLVRRFNHRLLERALAKGLAHVPRGGVVLDAPCGTGILTPFLRGLGLRVLGVDISPAMLEVAHERGGTIGHARVDLEHPGLKPKSVDAALASRFYMHLPAELRPRMLRTLGELSRGPVVVTVCHPHTWKHFGRALRRAFGGKAKNSIRLTRAEVEAEVRAAGLVLERLIWVAPLLSEVWVMVVTAPHPSS